MTQLAPSETSEISLMKACLSNASLANEDMIVLNQYGEGGRRLEWKYLADNVPQFNAYVTNCNLCFEI